MSSPSQELTEVPVSEVAFSPLIQADGEATDFGRAVWGICWGGFFYLLIVAAVITVATWADFGRQPAGLFAPFAWAVPFIALVVVFAGVPLAMFNLVVCTVVLRSLRSGVTWPTAAAIAGGLTGFAPTLLLVSEFDHQSYLYVVMVLLGPMAATLFGQAGAAWATLRPRSAPASRASPTPSDANVGMRFDVRQLLLGTVWLAVLLTALKFTGTLTIYMGAVIAGWLLLQTLTLMIVLRAVRSIRGHRLSNPRPALDAGAE